MIFIISLVLTCQAQDYHSFIQEAEKFIQDKKYEEALAAYEKAFNSGDPHYADYYNAVCISALLDKNNAAFDYLDKAIQAGLIEKSWLEGDPDLENLRQDERWPQMLANMDIKATVLESSLPDSHEVMDMIMLPEPRYESEVSVEEALKNRRSIRSYTDRATSLQEISQLLWAAYGITKPIKNGPSFLRGGLRTPPSAGARYPLELYLVVKEVSDLSPGLYWYQSETHQLAKLSEENLWNRLSDVCFNQPMFETAAAALVYSAVFERTTERYGDRGRERYVCMDLGHSAQNVYLQAVALKMGTCAIGAFSDLQLKFVIGMTKKEEPLYVMPFGKIE